MILKYPPTSCPFICFCAPLAQQDRASDIPSFGMMNGCFRRGHSLLQKIDSNSSEVVSSSLAWGVTIYHHFSHPCSGPNA
ncbi:uncharacterized protein BT62DRAFT_264428 [Guyanagaster necrorhizus]|uniref:Uncharacterized protein n=1 Tax=Guyanagaster necrorhizus TaxID=856835 RepID=A0A9P7W440_9AGAR|nr:uncharacterized protein BT62DRAFT_264428 [Guyanagaster necrorhizus MCA 3950]KAG7451754.1 hypothetical protein BT62DRAFT_264428 [Guyanagaster necrorhizus MCA 3950]